MTAISGLQATLAMNILNLDANEYISDKRSFVAWIYRAELLLKICGTLAKHREFM
jgi:hypothetical protein